MVVARSRNDGWNAIEGVRSRRHDRSTRQEQVNRLLPPHALRQPADAVVLRSSRARTAAGVWPSRSACRVDLLLDLVVADVQRPRAAPPRRAPSRLAPLRGPARAALCAGRPSRPWRSAGRSPARASRAATCSSRRAISRSTRASGTSTDRREESCRHEVVPHPAPGFGLSLARRAAGRSRSGSSASPACRNRPPTARTRRRRPGAARAGGCSCTVTAWVTRLPASSTGAHGRPDTAARTSSSRRRSGR